MKVLISFICIALAHAISLWSKPVVDPEPVDPYDYGVDYSFPIHHYQTRDNFFKQRYNKWMADCYAAYSQRECDATERARLEMALEQPPTHFNYTKLGFKKGKVPDEIFKEILAFYEENKESGKKPEQWPRGNTYVNAWEVPTYMINFEDKQLRGGWDIKNRIWEAMNPILSEWVGGRELEPTSLYGIRVYERGAYLATHVDRLPLVTSAIIQVAQDTDEPWPVEIIGHDGKAYNVTLEPGEMAMYESHTTLHGRPFPLNGKFFANVFVHFKPVEYDDLREQFVLDKAAGLDVSHYGKTPVVKDGADTSSTSTASDINAKLNMHKASVYSKDKGGHEHDQHDEETLKRHMNDIDKEELTKKVTEIKKLFRDEEKAPLGGKNVENPDGRTALHEAASAGEYAEVVRLLGNQDTDMLNARDENGWQAIHEAARSGSLDIVKFLVDMGADIGSETTNGGTVLWWARRMLPEDHEVIHYFEGINAPDVWSGDEESADSEGGREENEEENKEENEENFPADDTDATGFVSNE